MAEPQDRVDADLETWSRTWPDLDTSPAAVVDRLRRVARLADQELAATLERFGLTQAGFDLIAAIRRAGGADQALQSELLAELEYTSGTLSVRLGRLEEAGLVARRTDPNDRRGVIVALTAAGRELVDAVVPEQVEAYRRVLAPLDPAERRSLVVLLRSLLAGYESQVDAARAAALLGVTVVPPDRARQLRRSVGLPDRPGVLVDDVAPGSSAARAGLGRGDLIVAARTGAGRVTSVRAPADLARALSCAGRKLVLTIARRGEEQATTLHL